MEIPDISIIVPVYNTEKYLSKCIESIMSQSFCNIEIILVDDGSTDDSQKILSHYAAIDKRIVLIHQENQGLSDARNVGMRRAKGEYIMFVDSDDWIEREACEKAMFAAKSTLSDIVIWTYVREYSTSSRKVELFNMDASVWHGNEKNAVLRQLIGPYGGKITHPERIDNLSVVWNKLYKKSKVIHEEFVDTKLIGTEDLLFNVYAFYYADTITFIPEALYHYRYGNPYSVTRGYQRDFKGKWVNLFRYLDSFIEEKSLSNDFKAALKNRICLSFIGLSMRVVSSNSLTNKEKINELKTIRELPTYNQAYSGWDANQFPIHWKVYFFLVKYRLYLPLLYLCKVMNKIRRNVGG